jgi:dihydrofolate reductase
MIISIIVAASVNNAIGKNNWLLWHLPNDLKFFKNTTWAMPVVMGRKTFESLGNKPLPGRLNIIVTRQTHWNADGVRVAASLKDAVNLAEQNNYKEIFIAGGGEIYKQAYEIADKIYLTRVFTETDADTFFPVIDTGIWKLKSNREFSADEKHAYDYSFQLWQKQ